MFFPGSGGKPKKANLFCSSCPIKTQCLAEAIKFGLKGFWAGTTDAERDFMARLKKIKVVDIQEFMPPEPKPRRVFRAVTLAPPVSTLDHLDTLVSPLDTL